jgi:tRNA(fMet)-specific endonuclease VapC
MHILDTDILTHLHAGDPRVVEKLRGLTDPDVAITIITKIELLRGRFDFLLKAATGEELQRAQEWLTRSEELLEQLVVIPVDERVARQFDRLRTTRKYREIGRADLLIATITLVYEATLVTRNVRHFQQIHGLTVVNWMK